MGTSSITIFNRSKPSDGDASAVSTIAVLYRQSDGYPTGMGADILECFKGKKPVNGFSEDDEVNGGHDMAVQLIAFLKEKLSVRLRLPDQNLGEEALSTPREVFTCTRPAPRMPVWSTSTL
jgi:hypothetical protein